MPLYSLGGGILETDLPFPELPPAPEAPPDWSFRLLSASPQNPREDPREGGWYHQWTAPQEEADKEGEEKEDQPWLLMARRPGGYLLRFPRHGDFRISIEARTIACAPLPGIPADTLRHLLLDQVMPLLLGTGTRLVLHASAVAGAHGAFAFMGMSGHGKSTLAAGFCRRNFRLITDDCLLLDLARQPPLAIPTYPGVRLWDDMAQTFAPRDAELESVAHYTSKKRLAFDGAQFCDAPVPLRRIYAIPEYDENAPPQEIAITPLGERESFLLLAQYAYQLDIDVPDRLKQNFTKFAALATQGFLRGLSFPYETGLLDSVLDTVLDDLASAPTLAV